MAAIPRLIRLARRADLVHSQGFESPLLGVAAIGALRLAGAAWWCRHPTTPSSAGAFCAAPVMALVRVLEWLTARTIVHTQSDVGRIRRGCAGASS